MAMVRVYHNNMYLSIENCLIRKKILQKQGSHCRPQLLSPSPIVKQSGLLCFISLLNVISNIDV